MKLNNKGWGTAEMLLLSGGILIALLVAIFFIYRFYNSFTKTLVVNEYTALESKLEDATSRYVNDNNISVEGELRVGLETLKNNSYIDKLEDEDGHSCSGYVTVSKDGLNTHYKGYVSCRDYQTENY